MPEGYWGDLIYKVEEEIKRLEEMAKPDDTEKTLLQKIDSDPKNLDLQFELVGILIGKNRLEDSVPVLLNIITVERNYKDKKAYT